MAAHERNKYDALIIPADLPVDSAVGFTTTRQGGVSCGLYDSWNLGDHVGDDPELIARNRAQLTQYLPAMTRVRWLTQVHGTHVVAAHAACDGVEADAAWTDQPNIACAVMTADCLPVLLASRTGPWVAAVHGGWRGLAGGVLEATISACPHPSDSLCAWLGPAIGPTVFEVGEDVLAAFTIRYGAAISAYFQPLDSHHWLADIYGLARSILQQEGVHAVTGGNQCTYTDPTRFFSYRRDAETGRMASVVSLPPSFS